MLRPQDPEARHERAGDFELAEGLTPADRAEGVRHAEQAVTHCNRGFAHALARLAEAHFQAGDPENAQRVAREVLELMAGRDARWLPVAEAGRRLQRSRGTLQPTQTSR